jgi:hypothetical protein
LITETQIFMVSRVPQCRARLESLLKSYLWTWSATFCGIDSKQNVLFKAVDWGLILSIPVHAFSAPMYCRSLICSRLDMAERERREAVEQVLQQQIDQRREARGAL